MGRLPRGKHDSRADEHKRTRAGRTAVTGMLAILALLLAACSTSSASSTQNGNGSSGSDNTPILFGATNALTGPVASTCKPASDGTAAWFSQVNATGGIHGRQINYKVLDDAYDPARAVVNARTLVNDGVIASVSGCGLPNQNAANPILSAKGIAQVMPYTALPALVANPKSLYYSAIPNLPNQITGVIPFAMKTKGVGSLAVEVVQQPQTPTYLAAAKQATEKLGGKYLGAVYITAGQDPSTVALKLQQMHPDYVLLAVAVSDAAKLIQADQSLGFAPTKAYVGYTPQTSEVLLTALGTSLESKYIGASSVALAGMNGLTECENAIKKYGSGTPVNQYSIYGCAVAQIVQKTLDKIQGAITPASFVKALESWQDATLTGVMPPITITPTQHMAVHSEFLFTAANGAYQMQGTANIG